MAQVTSPILLDSTGQQIVTKLQTIADNVKPTADEIKMTSSDATTVKAKIDSLNSQTWKKENATYTANVDANNYTTPGFYQVGITTNSPYGSNPAYGVLIVFSGSSGHCQQLFTAGHNGNFFVRGRNSSSNAFSEWVQLAPTSKIENTYPLKSQSGYSTSQTIEDFLDTLPTNESWMTTITANGSTGDLATLSNQHLFYIVQMAVGNSNNRFQLALAINTPKLYARAKLWWGTWTSWTLV